MKLPAFEDTDLPEEYREEYDKLRDLHDVMRMDEPTGKWWHTSPQRLTPGTVLVPHGAEAASEDFYQGTEELNQVSFAEDSGTLCDMGAPRSEWVWITITEDDAAFWAASVNGKYIYEVEPLDDPQPWNGTGVEGWVCQQARVTRRRKLRKSEK